MKATLATMRLPLVAARIDSLTSTLNTCVNPVYPSGMMGTSNSSFWLETGSCPSMQEGIQALFQYVGQSAGCTPRLNPSAGTVLGYLPSGRIDCALLTAMLPNAVRGGPYVSAFGLSSLPAGAGSTKPTAPTVFNQAGVMLGTSMFLTQNAAVQDKAVQTAQPDREVDLGDRTWATKGSSDLRLLVPSCAAIPETACFYKQFAQLGMIQNGNCSTMSSQFVSDMGAINKASYEGYYDNYNVDKASELASLKQYVIGIDWKDTSTSKLNFNVVINSSQNLNAGNNGPPRLERVLAPVRIGADAFLQNAKGPGYSATLVGIREMPKIMTTLQLNFANFLGPFFFEIVLLLPFCSVVVALVYEKEQKLRVMMQMMGLSSSAYWAINYTFFLMVYCVYTLVFVLVCSVNYGVAHITVFSAHDPSLVFVALFLFVNQTIAMALLWSVLIDKSKTALICSVLTIIFGALVGITLIQSFLESSVTPHATLVGVSLVPPFMLFRLLWEFAQAAFKADYMGIDGMQWSHMSEDPRNDMDEMMLIMLLEWFLFTLLAMYLDKILDKGVGIPSHPLFFLPQCLKTALGVNEDKVAENAEDDPQFNNPVLVGDSKAAEASRSDVLKEQERISKMDFQDAVGRDAVAIDRLRKVYPASNGNPPKVANRGVSFGVRHGECLGLLGPNGAGKTTCINMLCGFMQPTSGCAFVEGLNILFDMQKIYTVMGVCTQDNHLWDTLTAREHLLFYGRLKNLAGAELNASVSAALQSVKLLQHIDGYAGTFSGGMKRRLSVAISLIGDPLVCYLDEPSTGLDPASRRTLWTAIKEAKKKSSVLLTTHSMEEAEVLCERLGIFIDGGLHCLAPPKSLTERYGGTYVLTIASKLEKQAQIEEMVQGLSPAMKVTHSIAGTLVFELQTSECTLAQVFFVMMQQREELQIRDWGIANTTLEEVFITIAKGANAIGT